MAGTLDHLIQINSVSLRAVPQPDTEVARLSNRYVSSNFHLVEVWLLPQNEEVLTLKFLANASTNSAADLLTVLTEEKLSLVLMQRKLIDHFLPRLSAYECVGHCSILELPDGPVLSVVFGSEIAMEKVYEMGLRERLVAPK